MPRLLYTLRTAPCMNSPILPLYDELLRSSLALLANVDLTQSAWEQASLPIRYGGLGIRSAVMLAPSAFLASAAGAENIISSICHNDCKTSLIRLSKMPWLCGKRRLVKAHCHLTAPVAGFRRPGISHAVSGWQLTSFRKHRVRLIRLDC